MPRTHIVFAILPMYQAELASGDGDSPTAIANADRSIALMEANSQGLDYLSRFLLRRADVYLKARRFEEARADAERALEMELKAVPSETSSSAIGRSYLTLGRALRAKGRLDDARAAGVSALRHLEPSLGADHPMTRAARRLAGASP